MMGTLSVRILYRLLLRRIAQMSARMSRIGDTPEAVARGAASGAFVAFSPLFGLHFIIAPLIAWAVRGNILASLITVLICNPFTFPFIAASSVGLGMLVLGIPDYTNSAATVQSMGGLSTVLGGLLDGNGLEGFWQRIFLPYLIGGVALGTVASFGVLWTFRSLMGRMHRRRQRLASRRVQAAGNQTAPVTQNSATQIKEG